MTSCGSWVGILSARRNSFSSHEIHDHPLLRPLLSRPMTYDPQRHRRRSIRLPGFDYAQAGSYFVTMVTKDRECYFGDPGLRSVVQESWCWLARQYSYICLDEYVVMPNHVHGIVMIEQAVGAVREPPLRRRKTLGSIIGAFKTVSTKRFNAMRITPGLQLWQRNYYEHIIRSEAELNRIRQYIADNPSQWASDGENPAYRLAHRGTS